MASNQSESSMQREIDIPMQDDPHVPVVAAEIEIREQNNDDSAGSLPPLREPEFNQEPNTSFMPEHQPDLGSPPANIQPELSKQSQVLLMQRDMSNKDSIYAKMRRFALLSPAVPSCAKLMVERTRWKIQIRSDAMMIRSNHGVIIAINQVISQEIAPYLVFFIVIFVGKQVTYPDTAVKECKKKDIK
ncbi:hypothetical protein QAD02_020521 [Eretmocerus hayati]|uniref:Uncharacterized protein n=1 Tax=Eretmocerus hayati TaxID=131215 RepID=A0ACC2PMQ3_9HYME|nr:hypothetical protein QAD02_020521 [Eretmocerus hayati]